MMIEFKPPSLSAFQCRRVFHKCKRKQTEDYEEWFNRISDSMVDCAYGVFNDFMLIDKFMSGLNDYDLEQFSQKKLWSEKQILLFIKELKLNSQKYVDSIENMDNLKIPKSVDAIKNEDIESGSEHSGSKSVEDDQMSHKSEDEPNLVEYAEDELMLDINDKIDLNADSNKINFDDRESKCRDFEIERMLKQKQSTKNEQHTSYACALCDKNCLCRSKLEAHMRKHLHSGKTFECHLCGMYYPRLLDMKVHFKRMHIGSKKVRLHCTECDKTFLERINLERHIRIHKRLAQVYKCPKCGKEFKLLCRMKAHLAKHSNIVTEEFVCEICGQTKKSRKLLYMHRRTHSKVRYKCQVCGLLLKNSNTYRIHQRQHTGERPHKCILCPKSFVTAPSYKKHLMVHNKIKPHACSVCPGRFATPYHLKIHMNSHTGDKPFQCTQCKTRFSQPHSLNAHIKKFHQNDANQ